MKTMLVDTSILIDYLRVKNQKEQTKWYALTQNDYDFSISIVTYAELYSGKGVWKHKNAKQELEDLLSIFKILPLETDIAQQAGKIRANYQTNLLDAAIAATAITHDLILTTLNVKDFEKIKEIQLFHE